MRFKRPLLGFCSVMIFVGQMLRAQQIPPGSQLAEMRAKAEKGDATAELDLGSIYFKAKDYTEAVKWWRKASDQNFSKAQFNLALCYEMGCGVPQDDIQAVKWFRSAAEQNLAEAQFNLGVRYSKGHGVKKDDAEAVKWYRKAAEQNLAAAQYNLGLCYGTGQGVAQNDVEALKWHILSRAQGNEFAARIISDVEAGKTSVTPEQLAEGRRRANEWREKHKKSGNLGDGSTTNH